MNRSHKGTIFIANVPVDTLYMSGALQCIDRFIAERTPHYNIAINAAKVVEYQRDEKLQAAIREAHIRTADGQSIVWA